MRTAREDFSSCVRKVSADNQDGANTTGNYEEVEEELSFDQMTQPSERITPVPPQPRKPKEVYHISDFPQRYDLLRCVR